MISRGLTAKAGKTLAAVLILSAGYLLQAQSTSAPAATGTTANKNPNKLETEVVTITDAIAFPSKIIRKQGQFYLLLVNQTHRNAPKIFFDSPTAPAAQIPVLGRGLNLPYLPSAHRVAAIFNAPPGVYQLKWQATGRVLLTINIEQ